MSVFYVIRDGRLVPKASIADAIADRRSTFPTPRLSRLEPYASPVTGKEVASWRERDRDMEAAGAYDPRDLPRDHVYRRGRAVQLKETKNG